MGLFLAASAFKDASLDAVFQATQDYMKSHSVECSEVPRRETETAEDAYFFDPMQGWAVVLLPAYFCGNDVPYAQALSRVLETKASTVHVYDDDYWVHVLFDCGARVDQFCSFPDYFEEHDGALMKALWSGNAKTIGRHLGVDPARLEPYLSHQTGENLEEGVKAFPEDEFEIRDFWVFTDFRQKLGIRYPECTSYRRQLRLAKDFMDKVPSGGKNSM